MDTKNEPDPPVPIRPLLLKFITDENKKNKIIGHYTAVGSINPEFVKSASLGELNSTCLKLVGDGRFFKILYPPGWVGDRPMELTDIYWV